MTHKNLILSNTNIWILTGCIAVIFITFLIVILLIILKRKKGNIQKIDENFVLNIINYLGGKSNIANVNVENSRLKFNLNNLKLANLEELRKLSPKGVFVSNKDVKLLFEYDANKIKQFIDKNIE